MEKQVRAKRGLGGKRRHRKQAWQDVAICPRCDRELTQRPGDDGGHFPHKCG